MAATKPDLYKVLGVGRNASDAEIKKAYRRLARQYHPDTNAGDASAEERFKEISAAHDVLSDPDKRRAYDQGTGPFAAGSGAGFDPNAFGSFSDILSNLFGSGAGPGGGRRGGGAGGGPGAGGRARPQRGRDLETEVSLSFEEAVDGTQAALAIPTSTPCETCHGTGARPGTSPVVCPVCQGRGVESQGQGFFSITQPCSRCSGSGTIVESPCPTCGGSGARRTIRRLRVNIPAGVKDGSRVRIADKGEPGANGGPPGDLFVVTRVESSPIFRRVGDRIEVEVPLTVVGALQRLRGEGAPRLGGRGRGDIHYRFTIELPRSLNAEQRDAVERLGQVVNGNPRERLFSGGRTEATA